MDLDRVPYSITAGTRVASTGLVGDTVTKAGNVRGQESQVTREG